MERIKAVRFIRKHWEPTIVMAQLKDGREVKVFDYFDDEISISADELIGKTLEEAYEVKRQKDLAYLRS